MGTIVVTRPPRRAAPDVPAGDLAIDAPPEIPQETGGRWTMLLLALPMLVGTVATALMFSGRDGNAYSYVVGGMFGISSLAMLATSWGTYHGGPRRAELVRARRDYLRHLARLRKRVRETVVRQRTGLYYRHPGPEHLWSTVDSYRLWERRPADADFAVVRVARGPQTLATPLAPPVTRPLEDLEPTTVGALRRFLDAYSVVPDLPVAVSLRGFARVYVLGDDHGSLTRAVIAQLATFHAPDDLLVAVCVEPSRRDAYEWVKWLPHARHPTRMDALGGRRLVATTGPELDELLGDCSRHHVLAIVDGVRWDVPPRDGVTVWDLTTPPPRLLDGTALILTIRDGRLHTRALDDEADVGVSDRLSAAEAAAVARRLAPLRLAMSCASAEPTDLDAASLLGILDAPPPRADRDRLRVPIGAGAGGTPVVLDLKESAQDGMGPHGLLIGATGSGKSELLRTLVLGLAATHSSESLNFVLVDFKGGATFAPMERLPHTAAVITNLAGDLPLVDRMTEALNGEVNRRQEVLRRAGNVASLRDYERARRGGAALAPLPVLLVVCDEFSELLSVKPDFIDLFVQIGRLGRSLGIHLLLASQRLEDGRLRGLETHLSYRIGLRTFSALESRAVLGVPDAYELPRTPGHGFLKYGTEPLHRFRAAYVSGPFRRPAGAPDRVLPFDTRYVPVPPEAPTTGGSLLDTVVDRLAGNGPPAHPVWLPPLSTPSTVDELLGPTTVDEECGPTTVNPALRGALQVPVALVDKPYDQRRDVLWLPLDGAAGHVAVVGGPRSGKSTLLRTLVTGLALTHTPAEIHVYCLDFGGGTLAGLSRLPHVGGVAGRLDIAAVRRTVGELAMLLADRERGSDAGAHVFLVVDGWATVRGEYDDLEDVVTDIATRGLAYRIHVVVTASRWTDLRPAFRDLFGSRLELRLGDPGDSMVDRKAAANVPQDVPGRGLTRDGLHFLAALPSTVDAIWPGPAAPPVRLLPSHVPYPLAGDGVLIGLAETDLRPVALDFAREPHFLLFGDAECGKSSFLRALAATIVDRFEPAEARIILVDYRRGLLGAIRTEHLIGYGTGAAQTAELVESAVGYLERRQPGPDVTPEQLRDRSWWSGPELFVLVDDYDLVATGPSNPLLPLLDHLPQARDIGLHLVLTRRSGGAGRSLYDPVIQRLRELSSPGLVMSGDREEGPLLGSVRPAPMPPGRGWLVTRKEHVRLIQLAHLPPDQAGREE